MSPETKILIAFPENLKFDSMGRCPDPKPNDEIQRRTHLHLSTQSRSTSAPPATSSGGFNLTRPLDSVHSPTVSLISPCGGLMSTERTNLGESHMISFVPSESELSWTNPNAPLSDCPAPNLPSPSTLTFANANDVDDESRRNNPLSPIACSNLMNRSQSADRHQTRGMMQFSHSPSQIYDGTPFPSSPLIPSYQTSPVSQFMPPLLQPNTPRLCRIHPQSQTTHTHHFLHSSPTPLSNSDSVSSFSSELFQNPVQIETLLSKTPQLFQACSNLMKVLDEMEDELYPLLDAEFKRDNTKVTAIDIVPNMA
ncbi:hypothetical protein BLNAU_19696 [Blattamonas nauphoetae]|uniref:Uncharacterized protein n=1 Tax=Blattamonas nauphoetae TaxID=2049346 RepID=A0ABQ9X0Z5_9EUKA|nr:hypothetical protein BLNAU_19696 [Blattamonas nauphoetae]